MQCDKETSKLRVVRLFNGAIGTLFCCEEWGEVQRASRFVVCLRDKRRQTVYAKARRSGGYALLGSLVGCVVACMCLGPLWFMGPKPVTFYPNSVLLNFLFFFVALPPTLQPKLGIFNLSSPLLPTPWHNGSLFPVCSCC